MMILLDDISIDFFKKVFADDLIKPDFVTDESFQIEKALLFLKHPEQVVQQVGLLKLFNLLQEENIYQCFIHEYHWRMSDYFELTQKLYASQAVQSELNAVYGSLSWRITRPIRALKNLLKRLR